MSHAHVTTITVSMADDGTYRLQTFRHDQAASPDDTVQGQESIVEGLRALADQLERAGRAAFNR